MKPHSVKQHLLSGGSFLNLLVLLVNNRFQVSLKYSHRLLYVSFTSLLLYPIHLVELLLYSSKIKKTKLPVDPIFIIGHCRSGTTYLHNLLCQDKQFAFPSTYQCFLPGVFLTGKNFMKKINGKTLPKTRPMDNVEMNPDFPQEEEFGMLSLTPFSYYQTLFFPSSMMYFFKYYALMETPKIKTWENQYKQFIRKVMYNQQAKQLILKNPVNTVRIQHLIKMFPQAKFVYIHRVKEEVLRSTNKLYTDLLRINSFQSISTSELQKNIGHIYDETITQYMKQKQLIPSGQLIELSYHEFITDPFSQTKKIYDKLSLYGHEKASVYFQHYISEQRKYAPNTYNT